MNVKEAIMALGAIEELLLAGEYPNRPARLWVRNSLSYPMMSTGTNNGRVDIGSGRCAVGSDIDVLVAGHKIELALPDDNRWHELICLRGQNE